ncbi:RNA polymerase sigma-70 factor [Pedobacter xixiisoli]|uniref:RNA polymerase sigma-70 factor, ECF subfamily n=1 Tax=Pedobacter xixiisoli TaxID=1476464 RepID=A0A285ZVW4_9SPHI|nr:RNA polymerase sigma-70 factor [Pedobacter xixiisoli]SOD13782.1 RNA polymerase sigma-70 factor, ECF subfamily [Pedobacter xixiisoli]
MNKFSADYRHQVLLDASEGDEKAFAELFYEYSSNLLAFARKLSNNPSEAEEIIQNVFIRVWIHRDKLSEIENIKSWLYKFVVNESLTYIRKRGVRDRADLQFRTKAAIADNNIDKMVDLNELKRIVAKAVDCLPEQRKNIYNLSRNEGLSISQISELLNISPHTVKNTLVTSLKFIRDYLKKYGYSSYVFILLVIS